MAGLPAVVRVRGRTTPGTTPPPIKFEVPAVVDPIHTNGEPDIAIDPRGESS